MVSRRRVAALPAVWTVVALAATLFWKPLGIRHDSALLLECGRRVAAGEWPYRDFFEMNPPLVMYLSAAPALAARLLDVHPIAAFNVSLILLAAWSAWRALALSARWEQAPATILERAALAAPPLVLVAVQPDPGQREHLFFLLYYPFLMLRTGRWSGQRPGPRAWAYGLAAGIGVALKPYFVIAVLAPEIAFAVRHRRWGPLVKPETVAAACTGALYLLHFLLLPADVRGTFVDRIVPLLLSGYSAYDHPLSVVLVRIFRRAVVLAALLVAASWLARHSPLRVMTLPAGAFACGALIAVFVQRKGFSYHFQPVDQTLLLLLAMAAAGAAHRWMAGPRASPVAAAAAIGAIWVAPIVQVWRTDASSPWTPLFERISAPGDSVMVMSTSVTYAYPALLQTGRRAGSRHLSAALPVMALEAARQGSPGAPDLEAQMIEELKADLRRFRPVAVLIDRQPRCHGCPPGFQLHDYLEQRGVLDAMSGSYRYSEDEGGLAIYQRIQ